MVRLRPSSRPARFEDELAEAKRAILERERRIHDLQRHVELLEDHLALALRQAQQPETEPAPARISLPIAAPALTAELAVDEPAPQLAPALEPKVAGSIQWHPVGIGAAAATSAASSATETAVLEIEFTEETHFYAGLERDMSRGGLFIATYRMQPLGTPLTLHFTLPCGTDVTARGEVSWIRDTDRGGCRPGMGVVFTELSEPALRSLSRFCESCPPLYVEL
jgi:uncharacterized protein (TIGR02266 family)